MAADVLPLGFSPPISAWFRATFSEATPPQRLGWPSIARGEHTLLFAPTGSGKTLAAFLAGLDHLWRTPRETLGVRMLYVSPLKALNTDIERNLSLPLAGILETASRLGTPLKPLTVAVRSGDTSAADRRKFLAKPTDLLITTPESLHLLLTGKARETLRGISHVIVDEIHALCPNKRGVFLALLLERLQNINKSEFIRIGLSATQRPLEEVARYLGGWRLVDDRSNPGLSRWEPRPVTIVDAGGRKEYDLEVSYPSSAFGPASSGSIWPGVETKLHDLIGRHRSTIVFANNRRIVERLTSKLNESSRPADSDEEENEKTAEIARAHHGSLSLERRSAVEKALKNGEAKAVVATGSLEMGIDMGSVDLVCQVESPGEVSRALQRVGRAGHGVGGVSKGRLIAKTRGDLLETAALVRLMLAGEVETLRVPKNCLDVLAQQIVACVAVEDWDPRALFDLVRKAHPYQHLPAGAFESVLEMVSGRFASEAIRDLRARVVWDRTADRLRALPGTAQLALVGGGTIPDMGTYPVHLGAGGPRLGELDEEFIHERRVGETFVLGTSTWKIVAIEPQRVLVEKGTGGPAQVPFWHGETSGRSRELGEEVGRFTRELTESRDDPATVERLRRDCRLDESAAFSLLRYLRAQIAHAGVAPDDRTVLVESFRDQTGETGLAILTPFGSRLHRALKPIVAARLRERLGAEVALFSSDEGLIARLPGSDEPPLDILQGLNSDLAERSLREGLCETSHFGVRFRQNAARALLMPRPDPGKRAPLWLQRLRAKDLLQVVREVADFPIVVETIRECLEELDLPGLRRFFDAIESGEIRIVARQGETPSPFAGELLFGFKQSFLYESDDPRSVGTLSKGAARYDRSWLEPILNEPAEPNPFDSHAVQRLDARLRGSEFPPRTVEEAAERLRTLGDLSPSELDDAFARFVKELNERGRAKAIVLQAVAEPSRWVLDEEEPFYRTAFESSSRQDSTAAREATERIVKRYIRSRALVGLGDVLKRYPIDRTLAETILEDWSLRGGIARVIGDDGLPRWADRSRLAELRRTTLAKRRRETVAVRPEAFADFVRRRQGLASERFGIGKSGVERVLENLRGFAARADLWESEILPRRIEGYRPSWLNELFAEGRWTWRAASTRLDDEPLAVIVPRDFPETRPAGLLENPSNDEKTIEDCLADRGASFVEELSRATGLIPSRVRSSLDRLSRRGIVSNDRFDPLRAEARAALEVFPTKARAAGRARAGRRFDRPEGRWWLLNRQTPAVEDSLLSWIDAMLDRYGVLSRETASLDPWAPLWRDLVPLLDLQEWRGRLKRGYFVEGLSGLQYATGEAAEELADRGIRSAGDEGRPILLSTADPANLYGSGAPFDVPLLEGGTARLSRTDANHLVLIRGRPVLIAEGRGKRITWLHSSSDDESRAAFGLLSSLTGPSRRTLKLETIDGRPALESRAATWLLEFGFVRDPPGLAFYLGW